jgi:hypothetical protein
LAEVKIDRRAGKMADMHGVQGGPPHKKEMKLGESNGEVMEGKQARARGRRGILSVLEERGDVEFRGCTPIPYEERTETNYFNIFTLWFSMSCNPLP